MMEQGHDIRGISGGKDIIYFQIQYKNFQA